MGDRDDRCRPGARRGWRRALLVAALATATAALAAPAVAASPDVDPPRIVFTPNPAVPRAPSGWYTDLSAFGSVPFVIDFLDAAGLEAVGCAGSLAFRYGPPVVLGTSFGYSAGFAADGVHVFSCAAVDDLGNAGVGTGSSPMPVVVRIDATAPELTCPAMPTFRQGATGSLAVRVADATSGPSTRAVVVGADTSQPGVFTVEATATDRAGNIGHAACPYEVVARAP